MFLAGGPDRHSLREGAADVRGEEASKECLGVEDEDEDFLRQAPVASTRLGNVIITLPTTLTSMTLVCPH
jgi:hypothetical protein